MAMNIFSGLDSVHLLERCYSFFQLWDSAKWEESQVDNTCLSSSYELFEEKVIQLK